MAYLFVHEKVADYGKWRNVYDSLTDVKKARGFLSTKVMKNGSDPNEIVIVESWKSLDAAKGWGQSQEIKAAMKEAGVLPTPIVLFLEDA